MMPSNRVPIVSPTSIDDLLRLSSDDLASVDIGLCNLICAEGLRGSEDLDIPSSLKTFDEMAEAVRVSTASLWKQFERSPEDYYGSPAYFRLLVLVTVLQRDFGVSYNVDWFERPPDFTDARLLFIHGLLVGSVGTCSSLPVLYTAVGRRLGYPIKLVSAVSHLFCRWDDPPAGERINIEAASRGLTCHSDDHYKTWPLPMQPEDLSGTYYLRSYTPAEEFACFLVTRSHCQSDWYRFGDAVELLNHACTLFPTEPNFNGFHAIATVAFRQQTGIATYDAAAQTVSERGAERPMLAWEHWAVRANDENAERRQRIHRATTNATFADQALTTY